MSIDYRVGDFIDPPVDRPLNFTNFMHTYVSPESREQPVPIISEEVALNILSGNNDHGIFLTLDFHSTVDDVSFMLRLSEALRSKTCRLGSICIKGKKLSSTACKIFAEVLLFQDIRRVDISVNSSGTVIPYFDELELWNSSIRSCLINKTRSSIKKDWLNLKERCLKVMLKSVGTKTATTEEHVEFLNLGNFIRQLPEDNILFGIINKEIIGWLKNEEGEFEENPDSIIVPALKRIAFPRAEASSSDGLPPPPSSSSPASSSGDGASSSDADCVIL